MEQEGNVWNTLEATVLYSARARLTPTLTHVVAYELATSGAEDGAMSNTAAEVGPHSFTYTFDRRNFDPCCSCRSTCVTHSTRVTDTSTRSSNEQSSSRAKFAVPESASSKYCYPGTVYIP